MKNIKNLMSFCMFIFLSCSFVIMSFCINVSANTDDIFYKGNKIAQIQNMCISKDIDYDMAIKEMSIYIEEPDIWNNYFGSWKLVTNIDESNEFCWLCFDENELLGAVIGEYNNETGKFIITDKYYFKEYLDYIENMLIEDASIGGGV